MRLIFLFGVQAMYAINARKFDKDLCQRIDNKKEISKQNAAQTQKMLADIFSHFGRSRKEAEEIEKEIEGIKNDSSV